MKVYINKKEKEAIHSAWDYVNNLLEACSAEEGSETIQYLRDTLHGLNSVEKKLNKSNS